MQKVLLLQGTEPWGRDMLTSSERESTGFCLFIAYLGKMDSDLEYTKWRYLTHTATSHLPQKPPAGWELWSSWPWLRTSSSSSVFRQYPEKGGGLCLFHHLKSSCTLAFLPSSPPRSTSASLGTAWHQWQPHTEGHRAPQETKAERDTCCQEFRAAPEERDPEASLKLMLIPVKLWKSLGLQHFFRTLLQEEPPQGQLPPRSGRKPHRWSALLCLRAGPFPVVGCTAAAEAASGHMLA